MNLPKRIPNRLNKFDYSSCGAYFITICTQNRRNLLWKNVGAAIGRPQDIELSYYGIVTNEAISNIPSVYPMVSVDKYVIMPNHIHLLLQINSDINGRPVAAPTISNIVNHTKGYITRTIGLPIWQKLFYDHIIRNENDYNEVWQYIENNPLKWYEDSLFSNDNISLT